MSSPVGKIDDLKLILNFIMKNKKIKETSSCLIEVWSIATLATSDEVFGYDEAKADEQDMMTEDGGNNEEEQMPKLCERFLNASAKLSKNTFSNFSFCTLPNVQLLIRTDVSIIFTTIALSISREQPIFFIVTVYKNFFKE